MSNEITEFQINQISNQIIRLANSIDKICDRIGNLEADLAERTLKKKIINIIICIYPLLTIFFMFSNNHPDYNKSYEVSKDISKFIEVANN